MKKIIAIVKPFDLQQKLFIYEDTELKDTIETEISNIENALAKCCEDYNINIIDLVGIKDFCMKIKENLLNPTKYQLQNIQINLI